MDCERGCAGLMVYKRYKTGLFVKHQASLYVDLVQRGQENTHEHIDKMALGLIGQLKPEPLAGVAASTTSLLAANTRGACR
jgi:hypothetical protein